MEIRICRCCLAPGCDKDLLSAYQNNGVHEVYADIMKETFGIEFPNSAADIPNAPCICEDCITELQRAATFKKRVISNTEKFNQQLDKLNISQAGINMTCAMKQEHDAGVPDDDNIINETVHFDEIFYEDYTLPRINTEAASKRRTLRAAKRKTEQVSEQKRRKRERNKTEGRRRERTEKVENCKKATEISVLDKSGEPETESGATKPSKNWSLIAERRGSGPLLRETSLQLIARSTVCVFQWNKSRYRCFCCKEPFSDMAALRTHTDTQHTLAHIERMIIQQQNRLVKVEVSCVRCRICEQIVNFQELRTHLETVHSVEFKLCNEDLLVPFKLGSDVLQCQLCPEKFTVFRLLNIHMNRHYKKQVCHICGAAFSNLVFLNLHKSRTHRALRCAECDIAFGSRREARAHDKSAHKDAAAPVRKPRFPCAFCSERFYQEKCRVQHLVARHGMPRPAHACERCGKLFLTRSLRNNHVKSAHQPRPRTAECALCQKRFASRSDVARHMATHTRLKSFPCGACGGAFASRDSLRRHARRSCAARVAGT